MCDGVDDCPNGADEDDFTCPIPMTATVTPGNDMFTVKWVVTVAQQCVSIGTIANLLSSIQTILLTCPNNDTLT